MRDFLKNLRTTEFILLLTSIGSLSHRWLVGTLEEERVAFFPLQNILSVKGHVHVCVGGGNIFNKSIKINIPL